MLTRNQSLGQPSLYNLIPARGLIILIIGFAHVYGRIFDNSAFFCISQYDVLPVVFNERGEDPLERERGKEENTQKRTEVTHTHLK